MRFLLVTSTFCLFFPIPVGAASPRDYDGWLERLGHIAALEQLLNDSRERVLLGETEYFHVRIAAWAELQHVRNQIEEANARVARRWPWQR
mgnify:CR=1 FL=1